MRCSITFAFLRPSRNLLLASVCGAWLTLTAPGWGFAQTSTPTSQETGYTKQDQLACDDTIVSIASHCVANDTDDSDPYCSRQIVTFKVQGVSQSPAYTFHYAQNAHAFIYGAACLKNDQTSFIELSSSNLGNCAQCEWVDYFASTGAYIASSPAPREDRNLNRKLLNKKQKHLFLNSRLIRKIEISTTLSN